VSRVELSARYGKDSAQQFDSRECQNMVPSYYETGTGKGSYKYSSVWGYEHVEEIGRGDFFHGSYVVQPNKYSSSERLFCLNGLDLYEVFSNGTSTLRATLTGFINSDAIVRFADNGLVMCIVSGGGDAWFYDLSSASTASLITDPDFPSTVIDVVYIDTYFVWLEGRGSGNRIFISDNYATDPANCVNALDFTVAESQPDNAIRLMVLNGELLVFGNTTIEFYYNSGNVDFPFDINKGVTQNIGCFSPNSIVKMDNIIVFNGKTSASNNGIYVLSNYQLQEISDKYIVQALYGYSSTKMSSISLKEDFSYFYCFYLNNLMYCYDFSTGLWSTRTQENALGVTVPYGSRISSSFFGYNYFFSTAIIPINTVSNIFIQKKDIYTTDEVTNNTTLAPIEKINISRKLILPNISQENKNIQINRFEMDIQKGVGNVDDADPEISLSMSRDGGMTYGNARALKIGASGAYRGRVKASMLGTARDAVFKIESDSPVQQEWFCAYIDYEVMDE